MEQSQFNKESLATNGSGSSHLGKTLASRLAILHALTRSKHANEKINDTNLKL